MDHGTFRLQFGNVLRKSRSVVALSLWESKTSTSTTPSRRDELLHQVRFPAPLGRDYLWSHLTIYHSDRRWSDLVDLASEMYVV